MVHFRHFLAIDWSGAAGERQAGIALALSSAGTDSPELLRGGHRWSRGEVLDYLLHHLPPDTLVGLDLGVSLPFADKGAFFPEWEDSPDSAQALWALVDGICADDAHLGATSFVDHPVACHYFRRHGGREGARFGGGRGRFRVTEEAQARMGCRPYSNFNLVGAAQVGKSSLTGMRVLHRLGGSIPVWPFDPKPERGSLIVEIYTSLAAIEAGRTASSTKIRDYASLNAALARLDSAPIASDAPLSDHASDAILTSAWLRIAATHKELWNPPELAQVAQTEGWTFGAI